MSNVLDEIVDGLEPWSGVLPVLAGSRRPVVLGLDIGSSGTRAALFDQQGREIEGASVRAGYGHTPTDFATFDAEMLLEQVAKTIDSLFAKIPESAIRVELISISCFWHSLMGVGDAGNATTPVLGWADSRAVDAVYQLRSEFDEQKIHARTGCRFHSSYWPAKLRRLQTDEAERFHATSQWLSFADYLALQFFGETAISVSMASGTGLFNQHTCEWDEELIAALGLSRASLPEIASSQRTFNHLSPAYISRWPQLSEARMVPAVGDGAANSIGSGCHSSERLALMIGTSGAMRVCFVGVPPDRLPSELWCYRASRDRVLVGGALSDGGGLFNWLKESLLPAESFATVESELELLNPNAHGLTVLPFWAGERSTGWNPSARGAILGISLQTLPIEILRAAMEAIAYRFALIATALEPFAPGATVVASGNALRSSATWVQILADVLGRRVLVSERSEASIRGAALLALEATGKIQTIEKSSVLSSESVETVCEPNLQHHALYQEGFARQQRIYQKLFT
ncbi:MAG TPA: gluconokinase [Pyrinomonadaceae bacterium]|nr:gluconokinase [Pyrinomonadaceae bacterium]